MEIKAFSRKNTLCNLGVHGNFLCLIKKIYKKPTANILMWGDYYFPFKIEKKVRMSALTLFNAIPIKSQEDFSLYRQVYFKNDMERHRP